MTDERLREVAKKHARQAVCPTNRLGGDAPDAIELQNMVRAEEIIFYALKEAFALPEENAILERIEVQLANDLASGTPMVQLRLGDKVIVREFSAPSPWPTAAAQPIEWPFRREPMP